MAGILYYNLFLIIGFITSCLIFPKKDIWYKILSGGVIGNAALMFGIVPFAWVMGFSIAAHLALILIFAAAAAVYIACRRPVMMLLGGEEKVFDKKAVFLGVAPITFIICLLLTNHVMQPVEGGIASGQSTYGDLAMHMGFITSIAEQRVFPPEYNLLAGTRMSYPFLVDSLSSSLMLFGTPLRQAILIPSYVMSFLLTLGFYNLAYSITKRRSASVLAMWFFFLNGAFGFAYFFEGAKADKTVFTRIFTEYYKTPTNLNEMNVRWSNTICDMIIPQRTTMAGWMMVLYAMSLLKEAAQSGERRLFILLGLLAGVMPMIHTHSFLALGMMSVVVFFTCMPKKDVRGYIVNWVIYGAIALSMSMPQLFYWTFRQTVGNDSFLRWQFNWVNHNDPYLWFWLKNWGVIFLFAIPAFLDTSKENKRFTAGGILIFVAAEMILFQQNEYDNNKLFYIVYMLAVILVAEYLTRLFAKLYKNTRGTVLLAAAVIAAQTLSGALTIGREYVSGGEYRTFTDADISLAGWVSENTPADAVFATGTQHLNPVAALSGRNIYVGSQLYVYFHGYKEEYAKRSKHIEGLYKSPDAKRLRNNMDKIGADYLLLTNNERKSYNTDEHVLASLEKVYSDSAGNVIYKR